ncbi:hypothetical protein [Emticicia agri]|uniref:Outer membrane protein assembly factor BamE n=1 Tax=Emticicia agri TaxID=2492393 RepID=A0A4Q5LTA7_9BACT|nr:hypothetical protein [Emticicia agri]RYU92727.1 hypothetical protein EWM59_25655 [Emticicia agri]
MKYRKILIIVIILVVCIFLGLNALLKSLSVENDDEFNSIRWKNDLEIRSFMLASLEDNYLKKGLSKNEILTLLGTPDGQFSDVENDTLNNELGYNLGIVYLDPCDFIISFDKNQKVVSWEKSCR